MFHFIVVLEEAKIQQARNQTVTWSNDWNLGSCQKDNVGNLKKMFQILKLKKKVKVDGYFKLGHVTWTIEFRIGQNNHVT